MNGGNGPAAAGGTTAPPDGPAGAGPGAETGAAVGGGPVAGITGGGPEGAPAVEASDDGGGDDTGGGSSGAPPPLPPSPALKPREKSCGAAGGTPEVGDVGRPAAGLVDPEVRAGADGAPVGIPVDGMPVDGKFKPPDDPLDRGIAEPAVGGTGLDGPRATGIWFGPPIPEESCSSMSETGRSLPGFLLVFGSTGGRWFCGGLEFGPGAGAFAPGSSSSLEGRSDRFGLSGGGIHPAGVPPFRGDPPAKSRACTPSRGGAVLLGVWTVAILATCMEISAAMLALNASAADRDAETTAAISLTSALNRREAPIPPPCAAALSCSIFSLATLSISSS